MIITFFVSYTVVFMNGGFTSIGPGQINYAVLFIQAIFILAFSFKDGFNGHSPGKLITGAQVVAKDTLKPIGLGLSFRRNIPILVFQSLPVIPAIFAPASDFAGPANLICVILFLIMAYQLNKGPRWGDRLAKTMVISKKHRHRPPFDNRGILCKECGYNLTGNVSGKCPECGSAVTSS